MNHSLPFRRSPCASSLLKTRTKFFLRLQSAGTANRGLKSLPSHHFDRSNNSTGAQTQRWNTKMAETTPIIDVQRYLKGLNGHPFDIKERGGMRFGSKGLGKKFYDTQKGSFHIGKMVMIIL